MKEQTEGFDDYYEEYDKWFDEKSNIYQSEINALKMLFKREGKAVEIGLGTGRFAVALDIKEGVEPSVNMAKLAIQRGIKVDNAFGEKLPYENESINSILYITSLCFFNSADMALDEAFRVLKNNGNIIIAHVPKDSQLGKQYMAEKEEGKFYYNFTLRTNSEVHELLKKHNFINIKSVQTLFNGYDSTNIEEVKEGYGEGSFVVVKAEKRINLT